MKPKKQVRNRGVCGASSVQRMELKETSFLPWNGSFATLKKERVFRDLLEYNDYVLAVPSTHCLLSNDKRKVDCLRGFHVDVYDCTS